MELLPARESRAWTLILFGVAALVGIPFTLWRASADDELGEAVEVFLVMAGAGLLFVSVVSVLRTRLLLRRAQPMPEDAVVAGPNRTWRLSFAAFGVLIGLAPFLRNGFGDASGVFAAFGHGLCAGVALAVAFGLWYLRRYERLAKKQLVKAARGGPIYYAT